MSRKRISEADAYDSDGGFVEDAPKSKRAKTASRNAPSKELQKDSQGNGYWELSGKRRVTVSDFKNTRLVNIREYYEKDGVMLPGKKGISLSVEQYSSLIELLPQIEDALAGMGESVPRPNYDGKNKADAVSLPNQDESKNEGEDAGGVDDSASAEVQKPSSKLERFIHAKKNHEATSDEEE